jgi:DNA-binding NtrC family response regulator
MAVAAAAARLLVVEDDAAVRGFCARLLRMSGYDVAVAEDGCAALDLLRAQPYDLVLTDLHMPGIDGIELLEQIQLLYPDTDTIMITAFGTIDTAKRALKLGAFDFMLKPINAESLEHTVRQCLEYRRLRHEREHLS